MGKEVEAPSRHSVETRSITALVQPTVHVGERTLIASKDADVQEDSSVAIQNDQRQRSWIEPINYMSTADLPYQARKLTPSLNTGKTLENSLTRQQQSMWDWMRQDVPARNPHEEEEGLYEEQTRRGAISVTIKAARKRKYRTPIPLVCDISVLEWNSKTERAGTTA